MACSTNNSVVKGMLSMRGVTGLRIPPSDNSETAAAHAMAEAKNLKLCKAGAKIAVIHGTKEETPDESNIMKIIDIE